jgi:hypothetical protein
VADALAAGADPKMLCQTCPWTRACVTLPEMTKADVDQHISEVTDHHVEKDPASALIRTIMGVAIFGGRQNDAKVCPVFALRLKSSEGRSIAESVRTQMRAWDDSAVTT